VSSTEVAAVAHRGRPSTWSAGPSMEMGWAPKTAVVRYAVAYGR
jgi:hypothetical protein